MACLAVVGLFAQQIAGTMTAGNQAEQPALELRYRQFEVMAEGLARAQTEMKSDLSGKIDALGSQVRSQVEETGAKVETFGQVVTGVKAGLSRRLDELSDHVYKGKPEHSQEFKRITVKAPDGQELAWAWAIYYTETGRWKTGLYDLKLHTRVIRARQPSGGVQSYVEAYATNDQDKESRGVKLPLRIESVEFEERWPEGKRWFWWNPQLWFGAGGLAGLDLSLRLGPMLGCSFMGYGRTEADLTWRFLGLGLAWDDGPVGLFEPVAYNLGEPLPLVKNLWIGPVLGVDLAGDFYGGLGLSLNF